ncbi:MAG: MFS transporter [Chitinophagaceae bacterium]|nr:MFS transporter [Chitinophagaceae bacterium]
MTVQQPPKYILPVIVLAQFLCTSLWFAGNAVMRPLSQELHLDADFVAHLTSSVQFGFIIGTLLFAMLAIADRFSPSTVFMLSAVCAGMFNLGMSMQALQPTQVLLFRFFIGFFLAGIYPVGMKIAADYYQQGLGKSLGFLVGALVVGTAFPHLLSNMLQGVPWRYVLYSTTTLAIIGGVGIWLLVPDGPHRSKPQQFSFGAFATGFRQPAFRQAALGYFGHMWELYAFWAFVPAMLQYYNSTHPQSNIHIPLAAFVIIASGGLACVVAGYLSQSFGAANIARKALLLSCCCCLLSPLLLQQSSTIALLVFLWLWGLVVIADSPLFSSLVAKHAPAQSKGSALTIVNSIGFAITIVSIQCIHFLSGKIPLTFVYMLLAIGPVLGLIALRKRIIDTNM